MDFESTEAYMKLRSIGLQQRIRERLRTVKSKGIAERREMRNFLETIKSMQEAAQTRRSALPVNNSGSAAQATRTS